MSKEFTMMGYIMDQPVLLQRVLDQREEVCGGLVEVFREHPIKKIYMIGSGTSYHVSLMARNYFEKYLPVEVQVSIPTIFTNHEKVNNNGMYKNEEILVVAISQAGTSYSTVNALKKAKEAGYNTVAFTENLKSPITQYADRILHMQCEKEQVPPETKGYTTAVLSVYLWAIEAAKALGRLTPQEHGEKLAAAEQMVGMVPIVIAESKAWFERNKYELLTVQKLDIAGYGFNYVTAIEGTLKVGETFKRKAAGFELEELIHGTEMGYDANNYTMLVGADEAEYGRMLEIRDFLKKITSHVFVVSSEDIGDDSRDCRLSVKTTAELSPVLNVIPFQIFAALATETVGIDTTVYPHNFPGLGHSHYDGK